MVFLPSLDLLPLGMLTYCSGTPRASFRGREDHMARQTVPVRPPSVLVVQVAGARDWRPSVVDVSVAQQHHPVKCCSAYERKCGKQPNPKLPPVVCHEKGKTLKSVLFSEDRISEVFRFKASMWRFQEWKDPWIGWLTGLAWLKWATRSRREPHVSVGCVKS